MEKQIVQEIIAPFSLEGTVNQVKALGQGLINDTYLITTIEAEKPDYVLQRINNAIFQDVDLLQHNIEAVTQHIREKLIAAKATDIERKVLTFIPTQEGKTYVKYEDSYWRVMRFISDAITYEEVNPESSEIAGKAFGHFQAMLADIKEELGESIPNFHNMEFRLEELREAVQKDAQKRVAEVQPILDEIKQRAEWMCQAERLHREGKLPKRICHCDTKVNNMLFDQAGNVLCVIDLDTVMPSFVSSDIGDFLRSAANTGKEDDKDLNNVSFNMDIFCAFTKGYLESAKTFLTPLEIKLIPYAACLFPYMQCVRFLTDYINGDTYYKTQYAEHNLVRTKAQFKLLQSAENQLDKMKAFIAKN